MARVFLAVKDITPHIRGCLTLQRVVNLGVSYSRSRPGSFLSPPPPKFLKITFLKKFRLAFLKVKPSFIAGS